MDPAELPPIQRGVCDHCGQRHAKRRSKYCSAACRGRAKYQARLRGGKLYPYLLRWRKFRGRKGTPGEGMLTMIAEIMDNYLSDDRTGR